MIARIMHKFSTAPTKSSALPARPASGYPLVGLLKVPYSTFAGASDPQAGAPARQSGPAGFSLRARGLKPTALFSGAFRRFVTRTYV